ncbi:MAG: type II secretion system F family protein [Phycisphaerae bacterium]
MPPFAGDAMQLIGLYALPLTGSTLLAYGLYQVVNDLRRPQARKVEERLREKGSAALAAHNEKSAHDSIMRQQRLAESSLAFLLQKVKFMPRLQRALEQADLPWVAPTLCINLVGAAAAAYLALHFLGYGLGVQLVTAGCAILFPLLFVQFKRKWRVNKFVHQLPDVFDLMSQALRAGHSLPSAIHVVSQQMPAPVGAEFARVFHEQNLGIKIEEALLGMANRLDQMDTRLFVTAVLIQRTTGGDLAEVLDNISAVIRERIKLAGTVKALTAEGRLSGYVLFALPFAVFALEQVINPEYGRVLLDEQIGNYLLIGAGVAQILGLLMIKKIVNVKV